MGQIDIACLLKWYNVQITQYHLHSIPDKNACSESEQEETQTNSNWRTFYKITDLYSSKISMLWKITKGWETVLD